MRYLAIALLLLSCCTGGWAAYEPPEYPRNDGALQSIQAQLPGQAKLGETIKASFELRLDTDLTEDRALYIHISKDGKTYFVDVIQPNPPSTSWKQGEKVEIKGYSIQIPADLEPGKYDYVVGMYKDKATAKGQITIEGNAPKKEPLIITTGSFVDKYGTPHYWHINKAHTLIWDGKPFIPAGGMFIYDRDWNLVKAQIDQLKLYGVKNIYLHLGVNQPYVWKDYSDDDYRFFQQTIDYLDDNGFTYGIEFQALEAKGQGYSYPGGGARVDHVKTSGTVKAEEKGVRSAVFVVYDNVTGKEVQNGAARVVGENNLEADVVVPRDGDYRVVFASERPAPNDYTMYWWDDKYETYVKKVRDHYSKVKLGPGFRFLVDPLWNEMNNNHSFVPSAPAFAEQFTEWLQQRYGTIEKLNEAWKPVGNGWPTFNAAGSTISIERVDDKTTGALMQYCYSRSAKRFYSVEACSSQFNYDMREFIGRSLLYYCNDIADVWKQMNNVPVIFKCFSDIDWWHINDTGLATGHDGLGMESYGNGEPMLLFMGVHAYGECEQATKTTWVIVTETGEGNHQDAVLSRNKSIGYTDRLDTMYANYNALISGGAKGIYQFNMIGGRGTQDPWTDNLSRDPRQLEWIATYDKMLANAKGLVDYKPVAYYRFPSQFNPCSMELYSEPCDDFYNMGGWWWREPIERAQNNIWILPSISLKPDTPMFIVNLEKKPASERFGAELTQALGIGQRITMIGFRKDLGTIPAVDKYYTGKFGVNERGRKFQVLNPTPSSKVLNRTKSGEVWNLIDGNVQINSEQVFGQHGYQPQNLVWGDEKPIDPYTGMFELMGVKLLDLGPEMTGFTYKDNGVPVTVITARDESKITLPVKNGASYSYIGGRPAGTVTADSAEVALKPADLTLTKAKYPWGPEGIMVDSTDTTETVIIRGLEASQVVPKRVTEQSSAVPYIWIEGEKPVSHNFNYSALGGIPTLSGNAFLGLETAVDPPKDSGWYATYEFSAPANGTYQLWLRENYLSYSSPCLYRVDSGKWAEVSNSLVPHDTQVVTLYNAVEDERQVFAWYHYGAAKMTAGKHTITFRVDKPRPKGTVLTMADDRPYAKQIDCILLTQKGFVPNGKNKPSDLTAEVQLPMINLLSNPSVEFDSDKNEKCDGWKPSSESGLEWTKPGWGNLRLEGLFDINLGMKDAYAEMRALKITAGEEERSWSSVPVDVRSSKTFLAGGWMRSSGEGVEPYLRVSWLDASGKTIKVDQLQPKQRSGEWIEVSDNLSKPAGAVSATLSCTLNAGKAGTVWFDDLVLAREAANQ